MGEQLWKESPVIRDRVFSNKQGVAHFDDGAALVKILDSTMFLSISLPPAF
jgi:hypothetical protein